MSISKHGKANGVYTFGINDAQTLAIAALTGLQGNTLRINGEPEFEAEAQNEEGVTDGLVLGPQKKTFELEGLVVDRDLYNAAAGTGFSYDGDYYIIRNVGEAKGNREFLRGTFTGTAMAGIPDPAA
jgi:hypothetical protein